MAKTPAIPPHYEFAFATDWESCDAKRTYRPPWKPVGATPGTLKLSPGRAYRVTVRPDTQPADLAEILRVAPVCHVRTVRIPHGRPISAADLGGTLAKLRDIESVGLLCPYDSTDWTLSLRRVGGIVVQFDLVGWPIAEVVAAAGRVPRASALTLRTDGDGSRFSLRPLFGIRGLERVDIQHCHYSKQELDWTGLAGLTELRTLRVEYGILPKTFWREFAAFPRLKEIELDWPEGATAAGRLAGPKSLKTLKGVCLFSPVPAAFKALAGCPAIETVRIDQCTIDDAGAAGLGAIPAAKDVYLWNAKLSDAGMRALCRWPRVKSLVLAENDSTPTRITRAGFEALGDLGTLERLHLQGFEHVNAGGWAVLRRLPRLKRLKLFSRPPFDLLDAIGPLPTVGQLSLEYCNSVGPAGYGLLKDMPRLRSLAVHVHRYTPYHVPLDELGELRRLTRLFLGGLHKMTDDHLGRLAGLRDLEELFLDDAAKLTDRGIAGLSGLRTLRRVSLYGLPGLTDRGVSALAGLPRLETLSLRCTARVTDRGLADLGAARGLTALHLHYARNLTGDGLLRLVRRLRLEELHVDGSPDLTDEHLMRLADHPTLKRVEVVGCKNVTANGLKAAAAARPDWGQCEFNHWQAF